MTLPPPPTFASVADYGSRLGDADHWAPYVQEVLRRHGLPTRLNVDHSRQRADVATPTGMETGFVGSFPTFLVGGVVVKLFGYFGAWRHCFETELTMHRLLVGRPHIPAPTLIANGQLYAHGDPWPYLVTTRLHGHAWRDLRLPPAVGMRLATRLGEIVRHVHEIPPPDVPVFVPDWMHDNRDGCVARHLAWGTLPQHLVDQIPEFLLDAPTERTERTLIHADLTEDHLFIADNHLVGIIDWGDAFATDRHYELCALHLGAFGADKTLLDAFLSGYDWPVDDTFAARSMTAALLHQFDVFAGVTELAQNCATLEELATALWDVRKSP